MYLETILLTCNQIISTRNSNHFKRAYNCPNALTFTMFLKNQQFHKKMEYLP